MSRKNKQSGFGLYVMAVLVVIATAAGSYYILSGGTKPTENKPVTGEPPTITLVSEKKNVMLYLPKESDNGFYLEPEARTIEVKRSVLDSTVNALLATNKEPGLLENLIPQGTKLLGPITVTKHVATVNLSKEFVDNFSGGSDQEMLTLNSVIATIVNNSGGEVRKVQVLIEGKQTESLGGHYDLTQPLTIDSAVVKSEVGG